MQEDPGKNRSVDKKRKAIEGSNSVVNTSGKRARKSNSPSETGETAKAEPQWPDYFKEVSVREGSSTLTLGTSLLSVVQGVFNFGTSIVVLHFIFPCV